MAKIDENTVTWDQDPTNIQWDDDPTNGMTTGDKLAAGAGKAVVDIGRGAKQLLDMPATWLENKLSGTMVGRALGTAGSAAGMPTADQSAAATQQDVDESRKMDAPLMDTGAGSLGYLGGNIAATMLPLGLVSKLGKAAPEVSALSKYLLNPTTYKAAATAGAFQGALTPTTGGESHLANAGWGGVAGLAGNAVVNTAGRLAQPIKSSLSSGTGWAADILNKAGIPLDAAQQSGSAFLNRMRSSLNDNPFLAGAQRDLFGTQQKAFNRAVLSTMGEGADAATPDVMDRASSRINGVFKNILSNNDAKITDPVVDKLSSLQITANNEGAKGASSLANDIVGAVGKDGTIPGQTAYALKKTADRLAGSADSTLAYHARQVRSTLMDALNDSLSGEDQAAFANARGQFRNMKQLEGGLDIRGGDGNISPSKLAGVFAQKANRGQSVYGRGPQELVQLAQAGRKLLPDNFPNSGSAARGLAMYLPAMALGGADYLHDGDPVDAAKLAAEALILPKAMQMVIHSPVNYPRIGNYLVNGLPQNAWGTAARSVLQAPQAMPALGGALRRLPAAELQTRGAGLQP